VCAASGREKIRRTRDHYSPSISLSLFPLHPPPHPRPHCATIAPIHTHTHTLSPCCTQAEPLLAACLARRALLLGEEHPLVIKSRDNLQAMREVCTSRARTTDHTLPFPPPRSSHLPVCLPCGHRSSWHPTVPRLTACGQRKDGLAPSRRTEQPPATPPSPSNATSAASRSPAPGSPSTASVAAPAHGPAPGPASCPGPASRSPLPSLLFPGGVGATVRADPNAKSSPQSPAPPGGVHVAALRAQVRETTKHDDEMNQPLLFALASLLSHLIFSFRPCLLSVGQRSSRRPTTTSSRTKTLRRMMTTVTTMGRALAGAEAARSWCS
jgi:hypothetical protein